MATDSELAQTLKEKGLSCSKLKKLEMNKRKDAKMFQNFGFTEQAKRELESESRIKQLRSKVCLLK